MTPDQINLTISMATDWWDIKCPKCGVKALSVGGGPTHCMQCKYEPPGGHKDFNVAHDFCGKLGFLLAAMQELNIELVDMSMTKGHFIGAVNQRAFMAPDVDAVTLAIANHVAEIIG